MFGWSARLLGKIASAVTSGWQYITSAVKTGVELTQPLWTAITGQPAPISPTLPEVSDLVGAATSAWGKLFEFHSWEMVSPEFGVYSPFDWRYPHTMRIQGVMKNLATGERIIRWITVGSNTSLTMGEWLALAEDAAGNELLGSDWEFLYATDFEYYRTGEEVEAPTYEPGFEIGI